MQHQKDKGQDDGSVLRPPCGKLNREAHQAGLDLLNYLLDKSYGMSVKNVYALNSKEWCFFLLKCCKKDGLGSVISSVPG